MSAPRRVAVAIAVAVITGGAVVTAGYVHLRRSVQTRSGDQAVPGLRARVEVGFDGWGIPTIEASSELDLYRAQGFVHASDRLWQLELFQRIARGHLSEIFGESAIDADLLVRTLDLWGAAGAKVDRLQPADVALLEAYAEGVNARIDTWRGPWPPEFVVLGIDPQPWSARASVAIGTIMSLDLSNWRTELSRVGTVARLPAPLRDVLEPSYPAWGPTILQDAAAELRPVEPGPTPAGGRASRSRSGRVAPTLGESRSSGRRDVAARGLRDRPPRGPAVPDSADERRWDPVAFLSSFAFHASNSWAVGGSRTADGAPLLANDMHLSLRAPSTWYLNALHAADVDLHVAGLSIPGAPGVVVGLNRGIAWGFTNAMVDDADFVVESVNLDASMYHTGTDWTPFGRREVEVAVRGRDEPVRHVVRSTSRGPVITDLVPSGGLTLSLLWTAMDASNGAADGLLAMNRAVDGPTFRAALERFRSPNQNVIYASTDGELGYRLVGAVPDRGSADASGPIPFEALPAGWAGYRLADSLPALLNPPSDYLVSANNLQSRSSFDVVGVDYPLPFRARRIVDRVGAAREWTIDDMRALQLDTHSLWAHRLLPRAVAAARRIDAPDVAASLERWDLRVAEGSREAGWFHAWLYRLRQRIAADELDGSGWFPDGALDAILEAGDHAWVDDVRTPERERLADLEDDAMRTAIRVVADRAWGEIHRERSAHPLGAVRWLDLLFGLHVGPYPSPGGRHTVRPDDPGRWSALDSTAWAPPFTSEYGPSERFVAHLSAADPTGHFLLPTGQSGNPLDRHYRDMAGVWKEARLIPIGLDPAARRADASSRLGLVPIPRSADPEDPRSR